MFIEEYLSDLRRDRFAPAAILLYIRRVAARVREQIYSNPGAVRSMWSVALGFFAASFLAAVGIALLYDRRMAADFFLHTSLWTVAAFAYVMLFLELLRDRHGYALSALNVPVTLTLLRLVLAPGMGLFLLGRHFHPALLVLTALVGLLLVLHALGGHVRDRLESLTVIALGVMLSATVVHALVLGWYNLRVMTGAADSARGRVVGDVRWGA